jgi:hypothetical protein
LQNLLGQTFGDRQIAAKHGGLGLKQEPSNLGLVGLMQGRVTRDVLGDDVVRIELENLLGQRFRLADVATLNFKLRLLEKRINSCRGLSIHRTILRRSKQQEGLLPRFAFPVRLYKSGIL